MRRGGGLSGVERLIHARPFVRLNHGKQERIEQLLGDRVERGVHPVRDLRPSQAFFDMQAAHQRPRDKEFAAEQVHLNLAPLAPAVVYDTVDAGGRWLGRAGRIGLEHGWRRSCVAELVMADLVSDEKCLLERRPNPLVDDKVVLGHERRASVVEDRRARICWVDLEAPVLGNGDDEGVGICRIKPARHGGGMQLRGPSASEFNRVHASVAFGKEALTVGLRDARLDQHLLKGDLCRCAGFSVCLKASARSERRGLPHRRDHVRLWDLQRLAQRFENRMRRPRRIDFSLPQASDNLAGDAQRPRQRLAPFTRQRVERVRASLKLEPGRLMDDPGGIDARLVDGREGSVIVKLWCCHQSREIDELERELRVRLDIAREDITIMSLLHLEEVQHIL